MPKSRGRPPGRGKPKNRRRRPVRELAGRGIDMTDRAAVESGIRGLNAELMARRLLDP